MHSVLLKNCPHRLHERALRKMLESRTRIVRILHVRDPRPDGFGHVTFIDLPTHADALAAKRVLHGRLVKGRRLEVDLNNVREPEGVSHP